MTLKYHGPSNSLLISQDTLKSAAFHLMYSMKAIREAAGLPLDRYEVGPLSPADNAQQRLIAVAKELSIDLGSDWANEIDLRDLSNWS